MEFGAWRAKEHVLWEALWNQAAGPIALVDLSGRHLDVNPALCDLLGYDRETLLHLSPVEITYPGDYAMERETINSLIREEIDGFSSEKRLLRSDGRAVLMLVNSSLIRAPDGSPEMIVSQFHDITARRESERLWQQTLVNTPVGVASTDLAGRLSEANGKFCELVGLRRQELLGQPFTDLIYNGDQARVEALQTEFREGSIDTSTIEIRLRHRDGHTLWVLGRLGLVRGLEELPAYVVGQYEPIGDDTQLSEERLAELTRMALHDPLTEVANRSLLGDRFQQELCTLSKAGGVLLVLLVDLDGFKEVNDQYGHDAGDEILRAAARELSNVVRSGDTVARIGGDEFVVLAYLTNQGEAIKLRARVEQRLNTATSIAGGRIRVTASVGMSTTRDPSTSYSDLKNEADQDMYIRKHNLPSSTRTSGQLRIRRRGPY
ncbi:sensor domain-containing diguanylate cyclase [Actinopolyspora mzabensis]|uniref:sensor domain-containing diguanylate cyclase n=1 Tax=Actinopolyspora mzabensis TaxID=995066 RepID=UPI0015A0C751|nr:PAS domain S-box protein [Actinopolyspora mzabensis]